MDSTKATIKTSGLKKIHDIAKWLQSLTNKTNCNDKRELTNCMYSDRSSIKQSPVRVKFRQATRL